MDGLNQEEKDQKSQQQQQQLLGGISNSTISDEANIGAGWVAAMEDISDEDDKQDIKNLDTFGNERPPPQQTASEIKQVDTFGLERVKTDLVSAPPVMMAPQLSHMISDVSQIAEAQESIAEVFGEAPATTTTAEPTLLDFTSPVQDEKTLHDQHQREMLTLWEEGEGEGDPGASIQRNETEVSANLIQLDSTASSRSRDPESDVYVKAAASQVSLPAVNEGKSFDSRPPRPPRLPTAEEEQVEEPQSKKGNENPETEQKSSGSSSDDDVSDFVMKFAEAKPSMEELEDILGPKDGKEETTSGPSTGKDVASEAPKDDGYVRVGTKATIEPAFPETKPKDTKQTKGSSQGAAQEKRFKTPSVTSETPTAKAGPVPSATAAGTSNSIQPNTSLDRIVASLDDKTPSSANTSSKNLPQTNLVHAVSPAYTSASDPFDGTYTKTDPTESLDVPSKEGSSFWDGKATAMVKDGAKTGGTANMPENKGPHLVVDTGGGAKGKKSTIADSEEDNNTMGGRLWEAASLEAQRTANSKNGPEGNRFAESLMARTRSRADPDAVVTQSGSLDKRDMDRPNMVRIGENDDTFILNTALARKRVRVVQLLIVGLVGLLVGFLGSFYVQSSCHFISATVEVGQNGQMFSLHYGLWKYTPMDSVFQGYSYCYHYDNKYTSDSPMFPRWSSCIALAGGAFSLGVLWCYLIFGRVVTKFWRAAVIVAAVSGVLQLFTLFFFTGSVCRRDVCTLGPAGILSVVAGVVWFILAFEMHYNTPMTAWVADMSSSSEEEPGVLVANLEMTDFEVGAKAYVRRIVRGDTSPYRTLNQLQRDNALPIGESMLGRDFSTPEAGAYTPPLIV